MTKIERKQPFIDTKKLTRYQANVSILHWLGEYVKENKDIRFNQALFALLSGKDGEELLDFFEESVDTLSRVNVRGK